MGVAFRNEITLELETPGAIYTADVTAAHWSRDPLPWAQSLTIDSPHLQTAYRQRISIVAGPLHKKLPWDTYNAQVVKAEARGTILRKRRERRARLGIEDQR